MAMAYRHRPSASSASRSGLDEDDAAELEAPRTVLQAVTNSVREGLGSGFAVGRAGEVAHSEGPDSYAALAFAEVETAVPPANREASRRTGPRPTPEARAAARASILSTGPSFAPPARARPLVIGGDKPLHTRKVSFAANNPMPPPLAPMRLTGAGATATAATQPEVEEKDESATVDGDHHRAESSGRRGFAVGNVIAMIHTISSLKRWRSRSIGSVNASVESMRAAALSFQADTDQNEFGGMVARALVLDPQQAMRDSRAQRLAIEVDPRVCLTIDETSRYRQGDLAHYTTVKLLQRLGNSFDPRLLTWVKRFFDTCARPDAGPAQPFVTKAAYLRMLLLVHKQLMPETRAMEAVRIAREDWKQDARTWGTTVFDTDSAARGSGVGVAAALAHDDEEVGFTLAGFHGALFQLVDHWTSGCDAAEYVTFLSGMFARVTERNTDYVPKSKEGDHRKLVFKKLPSDYHKALNRHVGLEESRGDKKRGRAARAAKNAAPLFAMPPPTPNLVYVDAEEEPRRAPVPQASSSPVRSRTPDAPIAKPQPVEPEPPAEQQPADDRTDSHMGPPPQQLTMVRAEAEPADDSDSDEGTVTFAAGSKPPSRPPSRPQSCPGTSGASGSRAGSSAAVEASTANLTVVSLGTGILARLPAPTALRTATNNIGSTLAARAARKKKREGQTHYASAATANLMADMNELLQHAAAGVDDPVPTPAKRRSRGSGKKLHSGGSNGKRKRFNKRHPRGSVSQPATPPRSRSRSPQPQELEQRLRDLHMESSPMKTPRNHIRRMASISMPFDPLHKLLPLPPLEPAPVIMNADGSVNYSAMDESVARLVRPRLNHPQMSVVYNAEEAEGIIRSMVSGLDEDEGLDGSRVRMERAAAAANMRRQQQLQREYEINALSFALGERMRGASVSTEPTAEQLAAERRVIEEREFALPTQGRKLRSAGADLDDLLDELIANAGVEPDPEDVVEGAVEETAELPEGADASPAAESAGASPDTAAATDASQGDGDADGPSLSELTLDDNPTVDIRHSRQPSLTESITSGVSVSTTASITGPTASPAKKPRSKKSTRKKEQATAAPVTATVASATGASPTLAPNGETKTSRRATAAPDAVVAPSSTRESATLGVPAVSKERRRSTSSKPAHSTPSTPHSGPLLVPKKKKPRPGLASDTPLFDATTPTVSSPADSFSIDVATVNNAADESFTADDSIAAIDLTQLESGPAFEAHQANAAWLASMTAFGSNPVFSAALARVTQEAQTAELELEQAGVDLPPAKSKSIADLAAAVTQQQQQTETEDTLIVSVPREEDAEGFNAWAERALVSALEDGDSVEATFALGPGLGSDPSSAPSSTRLTPMNDRGSPPSSSRSPVRSPVRSRHPSRRPSMSLAVALSIADPFGAGFPMSVGAAPMHQSPLATTSGTSTPRVPAPSSPGGPQHTARRRRLRDEERARREAAGLDPDSESDMDPTEALPTLPLPDDWMEQVDAFFSEAPTSTPSLTTVKVVLPRASPESPRSQRNLSYQSRETRSPRNAPSPRSPRSPSSSPPSTMSHSFKPSSRASHGTVAPALTHTVEEDLPPLAIDENRPIAIGPELQAAIASTSKPPQLDQPLPPQPSRHPPTPVLSPSLATSPSSVLTDAIVATRSALHKLAAPAGVGSKAMPQTNATSQSQNQASSQPSIQTQGYGSLPLELSREIMTALRKLAPVGSLPVAPVLRPSSGVRGPALKSNEPASLHDLEGLILSLSALVPPPVGRKTLQVGRASFGPPPSVSPPPAHPLVPPTLQEANNPAVIIQAGLDVVSRQLRGRSRPHTAAGQDMLHELHAFATVGGMGRESSLSPSRMDNSRPPTSLSPTRQSHSQAAALQQLASAHQHPQPPTLLMDRPASGPASSPALDQFTANASRIPVPVAPPRGRTVHLSSGEYIRGWADSDAEEQGDAELCGISSRISPRASYKAPRVASNRSQSAAASLFAGNVIPMQAPATFDVAKGVSAAFTDPIAPAQPEPEPEPWTHSATFADDFEWRMDEHQKRPPRARTTRPRRRSPDRSSEDLGALMPLRSLTGHFSPVSYSRSLRQVVDREKARMAAASNESMMPSVFESTDGSLQGWARDTAEEKQPSPPATGHSAASPRTTMMMLANGGLKHVALGVAASPMPGAAYSMSPYLVNAPPADGSTPSPAAPGPTSFPYEVQSAAFAALAASFNAHPGQVLTIASSRPKTADRWLASTSAVGSKAMYRHNIGPSVVASPKYTSSRPGTSPLTAIRSHASRHVHALGPRETANTYPPQNVSLVPHVNITGTGGLAGPPLPPPGSLSARAHKHVAVAAAAAVAGSRTARTRSGRHASQMEEADLTLLAVSPFAQLAPFRPAFNRTG